MKEFYYSKKAKEYLEFLCNVQPNRRTGSPGNREATAFFADIIKEFGYSLDTTPFTCLDHIGLKAILTTEKHSFEVKMSPYSLSCNVTAPLVIVTTLEELENCICAGKLLLMKGDICKEQLMPKNFTFYNPDHHKKIYKLLETKKPAAIITATSKNPALVGALYPFPLLEDGDFDIPSVYCTDLVGDKIASLASATFKLVIEAERIKTTAYNVLAVKNPEAKKKIIICAHIDAYGESPGALDNASGTVVLLLLAEMLQDIKGKYRIELLAFNGEDNFTAGGQKDYLKRYGQELERIKFICNIDDVGYIKGETGISFYECPKIFKDQVCRIFNKYVGIIEGEQWYNGDHMIFVQQGIPSIACTSTMTNELMANITHTSKDKPELVDCGKLVELAKALQEFILGQINE